MHQTLAQTDPQHTCSAHSPQAEATTKNISLYLVMHQGVTCTKHLRKQTLNTPAAHTARKLKLQQNTSACT